MRYALLLSVAVVSLFALIGFIKPAQAGAGSHKITATYYKAYVHNDHDIDIIIKNPGEWRFGLESAVQGYTWTGEISVDGARTVDFSDRSRSWFITGNTWFRCRAEEWDGIFGIGLLDYYSWVKPSVLFPGTSVNRWHYGSQKVGDVTHYWKYYIQNLAPTANPINDQFVSVGVPVSFSGSGSDLEGDSLSYEWDFDDGTTSTQQNPTHTYTDIGTYNVKFRVKDYFGAYSDYKYATVTVTKVIINQTFVSDTRVDVGSNQTVSFHAKWAHDNASIVEGSIYVNETEHVTNGTGWISFNTTAYDTVGKRMWNVTQVNCNGITVYEKNITDPYIIWDRVNIQINAADGRINVGDTATLSWTGTYEYDGSTFTGSIAYNDTLSKTVVGKCGYKVASVTDPTYGLTEFTTNEVSVISDKVTVTLSAVDITVEVGSTASVTRTAVYQYDGTAFDGTITLNDTLTKSVVGTYHYTTESISSDTHGITAFESNTVAIEFLDTTAPVANAGPDQTVNEDTLVTFDGSDSTDIVGITSYTWTFTDVTPQTLTGEKPTYTFATPGTYTVTLKVADAAGNYATDTVVITVLDITNPVANAGPDQTVTVDTSVSFDASNSTDNVEIVSYEWDFGDETNGTGITTEHTYTEPGTYNVTLTVNDAAGNSATDKITITVEAAAAIPLWIIGSIGAAIAIIAIAAALLLRRRRAPKGP